MIYKILLTYVLIVFFPIVLMCLLVQYFGAPTWGVVLVGGITLLHTLNYASGLFIYLKGKKQKQFFEPVPLVTSTPAVSAFEVGAKLFAEAFIQVSLDEIFDYATKEVGVVHRVVSIDDYSLFPMYKVFISEFRADLNIKTKVDFVYICVFGVLASYKGDLIASSDSSISNAELIGDLHLGRIIRCCIIPNMNLGVIQNAD